MKTRRYSKQDYRTDDQRIALRAKVVPHSAEAEIGVLGSLLIDPHRCVDICVLNKITADSFYCESNKIVYQGIMDLASKGSQIDLITVTDHLRNNLKLIPLGGEEYMNRIVDSTPTAAHCLYYVEILRKKEVLREILRVTTEAQEKCYLEQSDADHVLAETEQGILAISNGMQSNKLSSLDDSMARVLKEAMLAYENTGSMSGMPTGLRNLDSLMLGLRRGEMIVLAARPSMGKTSLAMNICENLMTGEATGEMVPVLVFSCEMKQDALVMRMVFAKAGLTQKDITERWVRADEAERRLTEAMQGYARCPIYIDDTAGMDIADVRSKARKYKKDYGIQFIMIDYLQLLSSRERYDQGRQLETSFISSNIKAMAKELDVPVLVLSQLSRATEKEGGGKPRLSDLRDSGAIEQDADVVLMLRRPVKNSRDPDAIYPDLAYCEVAKNRNGDTGEAMLTFTAKKCKFTDRAQKEGDGQTMKPVPSNFVDVAGGGQVEQPMHGDEWSGYYDKDNMYKGW